MNKKYYAPALQVEEAQVAQMMLVESLGISDTEVDGAEALTKEESWELWSDEE